MRHAQFPVPVPQKSHRRLHCRILYLAFFITSIVLSRLLCFAAETCRRPQLDNECGTDVWPDVEDKMQDAREVEMPKGIGRDARNLHHGGTWQQDPRTLLLSTTFLDCSNIDQCSCSKSHEGMSCIHPHLVSDHGVINWQTGHLALSAMMTAWLSR
jgi:hypothetical protein